MPSRPEVVAGTRWRVLDEVEAALAGGQPVVALETSIWCQGLPYPQSIEGARRVDEAVREAGAIPAVLGLERGTIRVGLTLRELEVWCQEGDAVKAGARDLGVVL
jgi:pseudouridylate synthase